MNGLPGDSFRPQEFHEVALERLSSLQDKKETAFILLIIVIILIPHVFIIFGHQDIVLNRFTTDDSFYYFKTAQNIIEGHGISFDGIARTNGFHPLWMILLLPIFLIVRDDLIMALRLVIILQVLLGIGSSLILYKFVRTRCSLWTGWVVALIWTFSSFTYDLIYKGGTEAALNAFFLVLLWWRYYHVSEKLTLGKVYLLEIFVLGCLASLALLSRLDNVYLVFLVGIWLIFRFRRKPGNNITNLKESILWWIKLGLAYFSPILTTLGLYLGFNQVYIGSAMPVSGKIKRWWGTLNYTVYGKPPESVGEIISEIFSSDNSIGPWSIVVSPLSALFEWYNSLAIGNRVLWGAVLVALLCSIGFLLIKNREFVFRSFWQWNLIPLLVGCLFHILYYKILGHVAQKEWYWLAESFFVIMIFGIVLETFAIGISKYTTGEKLYVAVTLMMGIVFIIPYLRYPIQVISYVPGDENHFYLQRANWLEENTEPNSKIGMTGSGSSGYFVQDRVVVNLDGLISSQEYFINLQNSTADGYLEEIGLDYVFGNAYILNNTNPYQWNFDGRLIEFRYFEWADKTLTLFKFQ